MKSTTLSWLTFRVMSLEVALLKPGASAVKVYVPTGSWGKVYVPSGPETVERARPSALGKNDPFVLSKSYPHEEQDLAQCKCVSALSSTPKACKPLIPRRRLTAGTDENPSLMFGAEQNRRFCHPAVGHSW